MVTEALPYSSSFSLFNLSKHKSGRASTEHLCTWSSPHTFTGSFVPNSKTEVPELPMSPTLVRLFFLFYTSYPPDVAAVPSYCISSHNVALSQASFPLISLDYRLLKGRACDWLSLYTHMGEEGVLVDAQGSSSQCHGRIQEELGLVMAPKGGTRWCCSILHIWITSPGWGPSFLRWL